MNKKLNLPKLQKIAVIAGCAIVTMLCASETKAQNSTNEILEAEKVHNFISLRADLPAGILYYQVDGNLGQVFQKHLDNNQTVSFVASIRRKEINFSLDFLNPLTHSVQYSDTILSDPAYQSVEKFLGQIITLSKEVSKFNSEVSIEPKLETIVGKVMGIVDSPKTNGQQNKNANIMHMINNFGAPALTEWKYLYVKDKSTFKAIPVETDLFANITQLDKHIYDGNFNDTSGFLHDVKVQIELLASKNNLKDFTTQTKELEVFLKAKEHQIEKGRKLISLLQGNVSSYTLPNSITDPDEKANGSNFLLYTKYVLKQFIDDCNKIQADREALYKYIIELHKSAKLFIQSSRVNKRDNGCEGDNETIIGRSNIQHERLKLINITIAKREIKFDDNQMKISTVGKPLVVKIRLRANHTLIPEISTGIAFTDIGYAQYGTTTNAAGQMVVGEAKSKRLPVVATSCLNLIINGFDGIVHPLVQVGVGTGKDTPTMLGGAGLRFTQPFAFAIAFGAIYNFNNELNSLKIGDTISGTTAITNDLRYRLNTKPSFYIGIQYNF